MLKNYGKRSLIWCFVLIFVISWTAWGIMWYFDLTPGTDILSTGIWLLGGFGPTIGVVLFLTKTKGIKGVKGLFRTLTRWRVSKKWYLVVLGIPAFISLFAIFIGMIAGWITFSDLDLSQSWLLPIILIINTIFTGGVSEEVGWRGYILPKLQRNLSAFTASILLGGIWAGWHLPLFLIPGTTQVDWPLSWFLAMGFALSILFTWVYNSTEGSVLLIALFHGSVNTFISAVWLFLGTIDPNFARIISGSFITVSILVLVVNGAKTLSNSTRWTEPFFDRTL